MVCAEGIRISHSQIISLIPLLIFHRILKKTKQLVVDDLYVKWICSFTFRRILKIQNRKSNKNGLFICKMDTNYFRQAYILMYYMFMFHSSHSKQKWRNIWKIKLFETNYLYILQNQIIYPIWNLCYNHVNLDHI